MEHQIWQLLHKWRLHQKLNKVSCSLWQYTADFYSTIWTLMDIEGRVLVGVTIVAKIDYCDSIDIAESAIAILLLLQTTIAILLQYYWSLLLGTNKEHFTFCLCMLYLSTCQATQKLIIKVHKILKVNGYTLGKQLYYVSSCWKVCCLFSVCV